MKNSLVSIIVVNWNKRQLLHNCLSSLRNQSYQNLEIIVIDNGSSDGSADAVTANFAEAKLIALPENRGFAIGNNIGIKNAQGEYIALLNNDAQAHPQWIEELCLALEHYPEVGFVASKMLLYDTRDTIDAAGDIFSVVGVAEKRGWLTKDGEEFSFPLKIFGACAGAAMYRKKMLIELNGFDEDFSPAYYEDVDLDFRAQLKGYQCLYVPTAIVYHRGTTTLGLYSRPHVFLCNRNLTYVLIKNMPTQLLVKYSFKIIMYFLISSFYGYFKDIRNPTLLGRVAALRKLPIMLRKRRDIQRNKVVSNRYIDSLMIKGRFIAHLKKVLRKRLASLRILKEPCH